MMNRACSGVFLTKITKTTFSREQQTKKENLFSPVPRALLLLFTARSVFLLFFFVFLRRETKGKEYNADVSPFFFLYVRGVGGQNKT